LSFFSLQQHGKNPEIGKITVKRANLWFLQRIRRSGGRSLARGQRLAEKKKMALHWAVSTFLGEFRKLRVDKSWYHA
jgi:hypothetical protein